MREWWIISNPVAYADTDSGLHNHCMHVHCPASTAMSRPFFIIGNRSVGIIRPVLRDKQFADHVAKPRAAPETPLELGEALASETNVARADCPHCAGDVSASSIDARRSVGGLVISRGRVFDRREFEATSPASLMSCPVPYRTPSRRSSGRGGEPYPRIALCDDVAGVASAATRACRDDLCSPDYACRDRGEWMAHDPRRLPYRGVARKIA